MNSKFLSHIVSITLCAFLITSIGCSIKDKNLKRLGAVIVVGIAAKLIYDMVIEHKTQQVSNEKDVTDEYKKNHKELPAEPTLVSYRSSIKPGGVVNAGNQVSIVSQVEVVRGTNSETVDIQEKVIIFDNEDPLKEIKKFTKKINQETQRGGEFANEFKFTLPKGMPQGIYPIKTQVIIDGKAFSPVENKMQLVIHQQPNATGKRLIFAK